MKSKKIIGAIFAGLAVAAEARRVSSHTSAAAAAPLPKKPQTDGLPSQLTTTCPMPSVFDQDVCYVAESIDHLPAKLRTAYLPTHIATKIAPEQRAEAEARYKSARKAISVEPLSPEQLARQHFNTALELIYGKADAEGSYPLEVQNTLIPKLHSIVTQAFKDAIYTSESPSFRAVVRLARMNYLIKRDEYKQATTQIEEAAKENPHIVAAMMPGSGCKNYQDVERYLAYQTGDLTIEEAFGFLSLLNKLHLPQPLLSHLSKPYCDYFNYLPREYRVQELRYEAMYHGKGAESADQMIPALERFIPAEDLPAFRDFVVKTKATPRYVDQVESYLINNTEKIAFGFPFDQFLVKSREYTQRLSDTDLKVALLMTDDHGWWWQRNKIQSGIQILEKAEYFLDHMPTQQGEIWTEAVCLELAVDNPSYKNAIAFAKFALSKDLANPKQQALYFLAKYFAGENFVTEMVQEMKTRANAELLSWMAYYFDHAKYQYTGATTMAGRYNALMHTGQFEDFNNSKARIAFVRDVLDDAVASWQSSELQNDLSAIIESEIPKRSTQEILQDTIAENRTVIAVVLGSIATLSAGLAAWLAHKMRLNSQKEVAEMVEKINGKLKLGSETVSWVSSKQNRYQLKFADQATVEVKLAGVSYPLSGKIYKQMLQHFFSKAEISCDSEAITYHHQQNVWEQLKKVDAQETVKLMGQLQVDSAFLPDAMWECDLQANQIRLQLANANCATTQVKIKDQVMTIDTEAFANLAKIAAQSQSHFTLDKLKVTWNSCQQLPNADFFHNLYKLVKANLTYTEIIQSWLANPAIALQHSVEADGKTIALVLPANKVTLQIGGETCVVNTMRLQLILLELFNPKNSEVDNIFSEYTHVLKLELRQGMPTITAAQVQAAVKKIMALPDRKLDEHMGKFRTVKSSSHEVPTRTRILLRHPLAGAKEALTDEILCKLTAKHGNSLASEVESEQIAVRRKVVPAEKAKLQLSPLQEENSRMMMFHFQKLALGPQLNEAMRKDYYDFHIKRLFEIATQTFPADAAAAKKIRNLLRHFYQDVSLAEHRDLLGNYLRKNKFTTNDPVEFFDKFSRLMIRVQRSAIYNLYAALPRSDEQKIVNLVTRARDLLTQIKALDASMGQSAEVDDVATELLAKFGETYSVCRLVTRDNTPETYLFHRLNAEMRRSGLKPMLESIITAANAVAHDVDYSQIMPIETVREWVALIASNWNGKVRAEPTEAAAAPANELRW